MHHQDPVQGLKAPQPPSTRNKRSPRQRTGLLLAIVIVNSTPPGTSVLDRLGRIIQDREQQKQQQQQQEQQKCTDATKSQQPTTLPQDEDEEGVEKDGSGGRRDDFSPDRTRSPSPRLAERRQQQQQQTQQLGFGNSTAGGRDQAWKLREKLLETEIDTLRRWKLNRQLEEDRERLRDLEKTDSCICRGGLQKVAKRRKTISAPNLATSEGSASEGFGSNSDAALLQQQQEDSTEELVEYKHRLLGHLDVVRRNQYFLEQVIASSEKQTTDREEVSPLLWNLSMTSNLILAVKEVTAMLCSSMIRFDLSENAYIHTMDAVQEYLRKPFLTPGQYKNVLQVLESSWGQLLLPILSNSAETYAETSISPSSSLPIARFGVAAEHQIHQQQQHSGSGEAHQSRCLGSLLRILLRALTQTLDTILRSNTSPQQQVEQQQRQDQPSGIDGDGGAYRFARKTRLTGKTKAAEQVERTRKSLASRQGTRQWQQQQEERCGLMVEIACELLSAYRQSSLFITERLERRRERCRSGSSDSGAMDESQYSADNDSSSRICTSSVDADELKRVEDDCNRLMSSICSIALFSPDVSTTTTTERPPRHVVSVWLTTRMQRLVSVDCFQ